VISKTTAIVRIDKISMTSGVTGAILHQTANDINGYQMIIIKWGGANSTCLLTSWNESAVHAGNPTNNWIRAMKWGEMGSNLYS
jgi:hypothetical protein